ncbi:hypothetical protein FALCPG4_011182 [Fusarium falciforme]
MNPPKSFVRSVAPRFLSYRILQRWGVAEGLLKVAAEPTSLIVHRYTGKTLAQEEDFDEKIRARYGAPFIDAHRVDLQMAVYDRAKQLGVRFEMGQKSLMATLAPPRFQLRLVTKYVLT